MVIRQTHCQAKRARATAPRQFHLTPHGTSHGVDNRGQTAVTVGWIPGPDGRTADGFLVFSDTMTPPSERKSCRQLL